MANKNGRDLIYKWDVVNELIQLENKYQFYKEQWDADVLYRRICELEIGIGKATAVDAVEVVNGEWEYGKWEQGHWVKGNERCRCSVCHRDFAVDNLNIWNGCPHCFAKMDGAGNGAV